MEKGCDHLDKELQRGQYRQLCFCRLVNHLLLSFLKTDFRSLSTFPIQRGVRWRVRRLYRVRPA